ncbi:hypothetical protein A3Q56_08444 [Intoshia linei]|uniref:Uncharacterized protein n=1 Tax=Intoshia linei TaxID=1819745 RepID=A0A177AR27_9BILA|nr:hypothetical protein A3Q56_08444 [Intoshia linei]
MGMEFYRIHIELNLNMKLMFLSCMYVETLKRCVQSYLTKHTILIFYESTLIFVLVQLSSDL